MRKIVLALVFTVLLMGAPRAATADEIPGLEPLTPGIIGAPSPEPTAAAQPAAQAPDAPGLADLVAASASPSFKPPQALTQAPMGYRNPFGTVQQIDANFWKGFSLNRLNPGTVLTGVLEDTISSGKNKQGDIFSIRLEDGYSLDGKEYIPKLSQVVGTIIRTTPAKYEKHGMPGQIQISLQTLVFPDGRTTPIYAYLDHNPAADMNQKPGTQAPTSVTGFPMQTLRGLVSLVTGRVGMNIRMPVYGQECKLEKGEAVPIRLTKPLDLSRMSLPPASTVQTPQPGLPGSSQPGAQQFGSSPSAMPATAPPINTSSPQGLAPVAPLAPVGPNLPGLSAPPAGMLFPPAASAPVAQSNFAGAPSVVPASASDPNAVFNGALHAQQPQADLADPF